MRRPPLVHARTFSVSVDATLKKLRTSVTHTKHNLLAFEDCYSSFFRVRFREWWLGYPGLPRKRPGRCPRPSLLSALLPTKLTPAPHQEVYNRFLLQSRTKRKKQNRSSRLGIVLERGWFLHSFHCNASGISYCAVTLTVHLLLLRFVMGILSSIAINNLVVTDGSHPPFPRFQFCSRRVDYPFDAVC